MTMEALRGRVSKLVEGNWREKAEALLEQRKKDRKGQVSRQFMNKLLLLTSIFNPSCLNCRTLGMFEGSQTILNVHGTQFCNLPRPTRKDRSGEQRTKRLCHRPRIGEGRRSVAPSAWSGIVTRLGVLGDNILMLGAEPIYVAVMYILFNYTPYLSDMGD